MTYQTRGVARGYWLYCEGNAHGGDPRDVLDKAACEKYGVTPDEYLAVFRKHATSREGR